MDNELQQLLTQNQHMLAETTGLLKRLHELSISIAEAQQEQIRELKLAHLDFELAVKEALLRLADIEHILAELASTVGVLGDHQRVLGEHQIRLGEIQFQMGVKIAELADNQATTDAKIAALVDNQATIQAALQALIAQIDRFVRGQQGNGQQ